MAERAVVLFVGAARAAKPYCEIPEWSAGHLVDLWRCRGEHRGLRRSHAPLPRAAPTPRSMPVAVVQVRVVRMRMPQRGVHVRVRVRLGAVPREVVRVLVVFVVDVAVLVLER